MKISEQITAFQKQRNAAAERRRQLLESSGDEGRTLDVEEKTEDETLRKEIKEIDEHLERLKEMEADAVVTEPTEPVVTRKGPTIIVRGQDPDDAFPGQSFVRKAICRAVAILEGFERTPAQIAKQRWGATHPMLVKVIESGVVTRANEVAGGGTGSGEWGAELVQADSRYMGDFISFLHDQTVFDQLPLMEVPAHVTIKGQDGTATGYWTGESKAGKVSAQDFSSVSLTPLKAMAISVVSNELLKHSSPSAEMLVRDSLAMSCAEVIDSTFVGAAAASGGVSPAGMLNGLSALGSNGYDGAAVRADIRDLYAPFLTAKHASGLYLVMNKARAKATGLIVNTLGQTEFPNLGADGGTLLGDKVVTGDNVAATTVMLIDPRNVYKIGDAGIEVSVSRDATLEQSTAPQGASDTPVAASATLSSMFQTDSTAFKVVRPINFAKRRATAVSFMDDVGWGDSSISTT